MTSRLGKARFHIASRRNVGFPRRKISENKTGIFKKPHMNEILGSKVILNFAFNLRLKSIQMLTMNKLYNEYVILI